MTNIMAFAKRELSKQKIQEKQVAAQQVCQLILPLELPCSSAVYGGNVGLAMADGLASNGREVSPGHQKLFAVGRSYVLGTGDARLIHYVASKLSPEQGSPLQIGEEILELCRNKIRFAEHAGEQLNFILVGPERGSLVVRHLAANRILEPLRKSGFAVDGSGAEFVSKAWERDAERGLQVDWGSYSLADVAFAFYDLGRVAMKSAGVNHELQYGFMTPDGKAALLHPNVDISIPLREYCDANGEPDQRKMERNAQFYGRFQNSLAEAASVQRVYNRLASLLREQQVAPEKKVLAHERLDEGVERLSRLRRDVNQMIMDYVGEYREF